MRMYVSRKKKQACTAPPNGVSLVMPLAPFGSLHAFLHQGAANAPDSETVATRDRGGGVLRRGLVRSSSIGNSVPASNGGDDGWGGGGQAGAGAGAAAAGVAGGGDDRRGRRKRHPHLSAALKAAMAFDVAKGMLHLHENGFLHGTLKPKNVLVGACTGGLVALEGG